MILWEYKTYIINGDIDVHNIERINQTLNYFGRFGWELVNIIPQISSATDYATGDVDIDISCCSDVYVGQNVLVFKRKIENCPKVVDDTDEGI